MTAYPKLKDSQLPLVDRARYCRNSGGSNLSSKTKCPLDYPHNRRVVQLIFYERERFPAVRLSTYRGRLPTDHKI